MGRDAVLVEDPPGGPAAWGAGVVARRLEGVIDVVPAARTVLLRWSPATLSESAIGQLESVEPIRAVDETGELVIPVTYDGPDLGVVAAATGLSVGEVVALHATATYEVAFCGFAPGFGYLAGLPERLHLPRRATPRTAVPAGSVAIAAGYSAVYPGPSPGGWHLIGSTALTLFDPEREPPALVVPGSRVRFEPT